MQFRVHSSQLGCDECKFKTVNYELFFGLQWNDGKL